MPSLTKVQERLHSDAAGSDIIGKDSGGKERRRTYGHPLFYIWSLFGSCLWLPKQIQNLFLERFEGGVRWLWHSEELKF